MPATNTTKKTPSHHKPSQDIASHRKTAKKSKNPEAMTFGQVRALAAALYHAKYTKAHMSELIDKLIEKHEVKVDKPMPADKKAQWLKEHGAEPATYGQGMMYAMTMFNLKLPKETVSAIIAKLDEESGYKPEPKEAKAEEATKTTEAAQA